MRNNRKQKRLRKADNSHKWKLVRYFFHRYKRKIFISFCLYKCINCGAKKAKDYRPIKNYLLFIPTNKYIIKYYYWPTKLYISQSYNCIPCNLCILQDIFQ